MLINNDGTNAGQDRSLFVEGETFNLFTYVYNDPINRIDPSGQAEDIPGVPHNLKPPEGVPVVFVYRYTEKEWETQRINRNEKRDFGKWTYIAIDKSDDPESVGSAGISNIGRGIHDFGFAPVVGVYSLITWSNKFYGPRDRTDYVDVTFKLSYDHYVGPASATDRDIANQEFYKHHADQQISELSGQLNNDLKYFYFEQFGGAVVAEIIGGVLRLHSALGEADSATGGVGVKTEEYFADQKADFSGKQVARIKFRGPSYDKVDWDHIFEAHADWGNTAKQRMASGSEDNTFFSGLTADQIKARVEGAFSVREKIATQLDVTTGVTRIQYRGTDPVSKRTIDMWLNTSTRVLESAYPTKGR